MKVFQGNIRGVKSTHPVNSATGRGRRRTKVYTSQGGPVRFILNLKSREIREKLTLNYSKAPDFPAIDPGLFMQRYDDFWMLGISHTGKDGRKFFDQLVHANWTQNSVNDVYQSLPYRYLGGEPVFVGEPGSGFRRHVRWSQRYVL